MKSPTYPLKLSLIIAPVSYFSALVQSVSQYKLEIKTIYSSSPVYKIQRISLSNHSFDATA